MAVTHPTATRNGITNYVVDQLDLNTPPATLVFQTAASATVATLTFANPAFTAAGSAGSQADGVARAGHAGFLITSDSSADITGTITKAELRQGAGTAIILCSVTATGGGGDIQLNSVNISSGQTVSMTDITYAAPP